MTSDERAYAFWSRLRSSDSDSCWEWTGHTVGGYGRLTYAGRRQMAHRLAWSLTNGEIPNGMDVLHRCDNPPCCNPAHLFLGTHADNMADMARKGRAQKRKGEQHPCAKLTAESVRDIRRLRAEGLTLARIGRQVGTHLSNVSLVLNGKAWTHV